MVATKLEDFNGQSKLTCWNIFLQSDSLTLDAFISLGTDNFLQNIFTLKASGKFAVNFYVYLKKISGAISD